MPPDREAVVRDSSFGFSLSFVGHGPRDRRAEKLLGLKLEGEEGVVTASKSVWEKAGIDENSPPGPSTRIRLSTTRSGSSPRERAEEINVIG